MVLASVVKTIQLLRWVLLRSQKRQPLLTTTFFIRTTLPRMIILHDQTLPRDQTDCWQNVRNRSSFHIRKYAVPLKSTTIKHVIFSVRQNKELSARSQRLLISYNQQAACVTIPVTFSSPYPCRDILALLPTQDGAQTLSVNRLA